jgi:hypothetical protein
MVRQVQDRLLRSSRFGPSCNVACQPDDAECPFEDTLVEWIQSWQHIAPERSRHLSPDESTLFSVSAAHLAQVRSTIPPL